MQETMMTFNPSACQLQQIKKLQIASNTTEDLKFPWCTKALNVSPKPMILYEITYVPALLFSWSIWSGETSDPLSTLLALTPSGDLGVGPSP